MVNYSSIIPSTQPLPLSISLYEGQGEFTDILVYNLMFKEEEVLGCRHPGTAFDIGNPAGYELCLSSAKDIHRKTLE